MNRHEARKVMRLLGLLPLLLFFPFPGSARLLGPVNRLKPLMKVVILDVWQGDSCLVILPNKKTILIDAGPGGSEYTKFDAGKSVVLPFLKKNRLSRIDLAVWTHPHSDHIGGFPYLLNRISCAQVYDCGMSYTTDLYINCLTVADKKKIKYTIPYAGDKTALDPAVRIDLLHPSRNWPYSTNPNDNSIVLRIKYGKVGFLFTGDAENEAEDFMIKSGRDLKAAVLKVPHHGSDTSSTEDFIDAVDPEVAVISVGRNNKFGLPTSATVAKYQSRDLKLMRTDQNGDITFTTDGVHFSVETSKKEF